VELELPYRTKFLLIAAFLASYNPARFDLKFFSGAGTRARSAAARTVRRCCSRCCNGQADGGGRRAHPRGGCWARAPLC
jgi:hypothetical protein